MTKPSVQIVVGSVSAVWKSELIVPLRFGNWNVVITHKTRSSSIEPPGGMTCEGGILGIQKRRFHIIHMVKLH